MTTGTTTSHRVSAAEQVLVDLARWIARARQYSASHPSCASLADETYASLSLALLHHAPIEYVVTRDEVTASGEASVHPSVRTRIAPFLHGRNVRSLRIAAGITRAELVTFVDVLLPLPQKIESGGGVAKIAKERGVSRVTVEEEGVLSDEERQELRRRDEMKRFFAEATGTLLARRELELQPAKLGELLERPEVAAAVVEDEARGGVAEGAALLAMLVRAHGAHDSDRAALGAALRAMSPEAKERIVLGFPFYGDAMRIAMLWALVPFSDDDLARFAFPAVRASAAEVGGALYAMSLVVPRDRGRLSVMRRVALFLYDLTDEDADRVLAELAKPISDFVSFRAEREALAEAARRALVTRATLRFGAAEHEAARHEAGRVLADVIAAASALPDFPDFCVRLPSAAVTLQHTDGPNATLGLLRGLGAAAATSEAAARAIDEIATRDTLPALLPAIDDAVAAADDHAIVGLAALAQRIARESPDAACDHLEETENRKMRLLLLDALPSARTSLLPIVRAKLKSPKWYVARNFVQLTARAGGAPRDLMGIARHPDERVRGEILRALRAMPFDEVTLDILIGYVNDPSMEVRPGARAMLRSESIVVGDTAVPRLDRIARDEKQDEDLRRVALDLLGRSHVDSAAETLYRFMQQSAPLLEPQLTTTLREVAAVALKRSRTAAGRRLFSEGLTSGTRRVRKACERAERGL